MNETSIPAKPVGSTFVTVLAWISIVLAGFSTFISILQNIMIFVMFRPEQMKQVTQQSTENEKMPWFFKLFSAHPEVFFLGLFLICLLTLIAAIGLLKRKNWARIIFITLMGLGIVWSIFSVMMQRSMSSSFPQAPNDDFNSHFKTMMFYMQIFSIIMAVGLSVLFGWIIRKLTSKAIRQEFEIFPDSAPAS